MAPQSLQEIGQVRGIAREKKKVGLVGDPSLTRCKSAGLRWSKRVKGEGGREEKRERDDVVRHVGRDAGECLGLSHICSTARIRRPYAL